jgi:hypothetical protein
MLNRWRYSASVIRVARFPAGKDFALTFVDDTDLSTRANTEPVYDFLWQHGLLGTKTVWVHRRKRTSAYRRDLERVVDAQDSSGSTLEDPEYLDFVRKLVNRGYEIATHGVAAGNSYREEIVEGLDTFHSLFGAYPRINIFHERNIENLYSGRHKLNLWPLQWLESLLHRSEYLGHVPASRYFWGDLAQKRITYMRVPFHTLRTVNTLRANPSMPFRDPYRPYVNYWFANSDGSDVQRFNTLLRTENLARLERECGACVVYTHFAKGFAVLRGGRYELDQGFIAIVRRLASRPNAWFPTASGLLDRLSSVRRVAIEHDGREITLNNLDSNAIEDVALHAPAGLILEDETGRRLDRTASGTVVLGTMQGHSSRRLLSNTPIRKRRFVYPTEAIGKMERARLEVMNYLGMLRG